MIIVIITLRITFPIKCSRYFLIVRTICFMTLTAKYCCFSQSSQAHDQYSMNELVLEKEKRKSKFWLGRKFAVPFPVKSMIFKMFISEFLNSLLQHTLVEIINVDWPTASNRRIGITNYQLAKDVGTNLTLVPHNIENSNCFFSQTLPFFQILCK